MNMSRVIGIAAAAGCAALMVAGCGTTHAAGTVPAAPATVKPKTTASTPQQRASADAASILAAFVPPEGAVRVSGPPGKALGAPVAIRGARDVVQKTSYWKVKGSPGSVLAWEKSHLPRQFTATGGGTIGGPGAQQVQEDNFVLPAVTGVLPARGLDVAAASAGGGYTAIRVVSQVTWVPSKPSSERIPATARVVTFSVAPGMVAGAKHPAPVTITNAAAVKRLEALINGLPVYPPGIRSCPADLGQSVQLTFAAAKNEPPLAVVKVPSGGCEGVSVTVNGKQQPSLDGTDGVAGKALAIAGVNWPGYGSAGNHLPSGVNPGGTMQHAGG